MRFARNRLVHFSFESNRLMFQFLGVFTTFNALNVQLCCASLRKADKVDSLLSHFRRIRVLRALDYWLLGDTDLVFLVDERVFLDGLVVQVLSLKNFSSFSVHSGEFHTPFLKISKKIRILEVIIFN